MSQNQFQNSRWNLLSKKNLPRKKVEFGTEYFQKLKNWREDTLIICIKKVSQIFRNSKTKLRMKKLQTKSNFERRKKYTSKIKNWKEDPLILFDKEVIP